MYRLAIGSLRLADQRELAVPLPECIAHAPGGARTVATGSSSRAVQIVDLLLVVDLDFKVEAEPERPRRRQ